MAITLLGLGVCCVIYLYDSRNGKGDTVLRKGEGCMVFIRWLISLVKGGRYRLATEIEECDETD
jgi:hypothetical protein